MIYRDTNRLCVQAGSRIHITNTLLGWLLEAWRSDRTWVVKQTCQNAMAVGRRRNEKGSKKWPEVRVHGQWQGLGRFVRAQKEKILEDQRQQKLGKGCTDRSGHKGGRAVHHMLGPSRK